MTKIYIGNLPQDIKERELEDLFGKFGRIKLVDIKNPNNRGPCFAFIDYEDPRDAEEAVRRRDNYDYYSFRLRVEVARGGTGHARDNFRPPQSTGFRVLVKGLPKGASWQDLKDHIRRAVKPMYTDVRFDGEGNTVGVVEFETREEMDTAIRKLDDSEFRNPRYDKGCYVRLVEDSNSGGGRGGGRDDRDRDRGRDDSRERGRERDRDRDRDDDDRRPARVERSASRSRSRSRTRSASR